MPRRSPAPLLLLAALSLLLAACDILYPPPSPPPETALSTDDEELHRWLFAEDLSCHERMDWTSDLWPCTELETPLGDVVRCELEPPLTQLEFGCGTAEEPLVPDPSIQYDERFRIIADNPQGGALIRKRFDELFGRCEIVERGPAAGEPARYPGDPGFRICQPGPVESAGATLESHPRAYTHGERPGEDGEGEPQGKAEVVYPMGVFLELPPASEDPAAAQRTAIAIETELLDEDQRDAAVALIPRLLEAFAE